MTLKRAVTKIRLSKPGPLESSTRLLWGFLGASLVAAIGKFFEGSRNSGIWLFAFLVILTVTSFKQSFPAAAYNGLVSGLFFNFFFSASNRELSFHSAGDVWLELLFIGVGIAAALFGRSMPRASSNSDRYPQLKAKETSADLLWKPRAWNGDPSEAKKKEKTWTL